MEKYMDNKRLLFTSLSIVLLPIVVFTLASLTVMEPLFAGLILIVCIGIIFFFYIRTRIQKNDYNKKSEEKNL